MVADFPHATDLPALLQELIAQHGHGEVLGAFNDSLRDRLKQLKLEDGATSQIRDGRKVRASLTESAQQLRELDL